MVRDASLRASPHHEVGTGPHPEEGREAAVSKDGSQILKRAAAMRAPQSLLRDGDA
jgi:hypothetical protein